MSNAVQVCTCRGSCSGPEGLGPGWVCALSEEYKRSLERITQYECESAMEKEATEWAAIRDILTERVAELEVRITAIREAIEKIVEPEGIDAGVILLSDESPTHWSEEHKCHVYEHENFSPLGDALVSLWKLAAGKSQPSSSAQ